MPREIQRLTVPITEFQISDNADPRGDWKGYANTFGFLDNNYGGINVPGCFQNSIADFLKNGFVPDSHGAATGGEYTVLGAYGYPTTAREDAKGLYFEGAFHSDPEAQVLRTRMSERASAGLSVGMSIGWQTLKSFRIYPKDYAAELPKYLAQQFREQGLKDAQNWPSILIREECALIETSLTLTPANTASLVTEVQSMKTEKLGKYLDVDSSLALSQITVLINELFYCIAYDVFCDPIPSADNRTAWAGALAEFSDYCLKIYDAYVASEAAEGEPMNDEGMNEVSAAQFFRENFINPKILNEPKALATKQFAQHAMSVLKQFVERESSLAEHRASKKAIGKLAGKVISKPNHDALKEVRDTLDEEMSSHADTMKDCLGKLDDFLEKFDPSAEKKNDDETNSKQTRLRALRMKQIAARLSTSKV